MNSAAQSLSLRSYRRLSTKVLPAEQQRQPEATTRRMPRSCQHRVRGAAGVASLTTVMKIFAPSLFPRQTCGSAFAQFKAKPNLHRSGNQWSEIPRGESDSRQKGLESRKTDCGYSQLPCPASNWVLDRYRNFSSDSQYWILG